MNHKITGWIAVGVFIAVYLGAVCVALRPPQWEILDVSSEWSDTMDQAKDGMIFTYVEPDYKHTLFTDGFNTALDCIMLLNLELKIVGGRKTFGEMNTICRDRNKVKSDAEQWAAGLVEAKAILTEPTISTPQPVDNPPTSDGEVAAEDTINDALTDSAYSIGHISNTGAAISDTFTFPTGLEVISDEDTCCKQYRISVKMPAEVFPDSSTEPTADTGITLSLDRRSFFFYWKTGSERMKVKTECAD